MDVLEFQANPVTETFTRHSKSMSVTFNTDAFTPDFFRSAAQMFRDIHARAKQGDTEATEAYKKAKKDENEKLLKSLDQPEVKDEVEKVEVKPEVKADTKPTEAKVKSEPKPAKPEPAKENPPA